MNGQKTERVNREFQHEQSAMRRRSMLHHIREYPFTPSFQVWAEENLGLKLRARTLGPPED